MKNLQLFSSSILRAILLNIVVMTVVLAIVEVIMHKFDVPHFDACNMGHDYGDADPELGFAPVPGSEVAGFKLNKHGLRGPLLSTKKTPGRFRILYIGDSTCWGLGVKLVDSFAALATRLIAEDNPNRRVEYILGAFPGYSSYQSKIMLKKLLPMEPDLVVFYVGANNDHTRARYFKDSDIPLRSARLNATWHKIHLLRLIESFSDKIYRKFLRKLRTRDAKARVPIKEFHENVTEMVKSVIKHEAHVIILIPPYSNHRLNRHPTIPKYQNSLETIARNFNVPFIKLQNIFESYEENLVYFSDLYHFNELGHKLTAYEIQRILAEELIVERTGI